ncbi:MAG: hypothetical protein V2J07_10510 [Anaerolineae bacterium]|jgi:hypothetical protein|nr:hypothetical protein [Anaerolineae bacterium]
MNIYPLLALLCFVYVGLVVWIAVKKPEKLWNMGKVKAFRKVLGDRGTEIFFYVIAAIFVGLGIWLFTL